MSFSTVPIRANGDDVHSGWWNDLRTAGLLLESFLGGSYIGLTSFTIANTQAAAANVTGLLFAGASVKAAFIDYRIRRYSTGGSGEERVEVGQLIAQYKANAATWTLTQMASAGDDAGVVFSITSGGQVQYTSDTLPGTPSESLMKFTAKTME